MKKTIYIISALLLSLVSCTDMPFEIQEPVKPEETGLVSVVMQLQVPVPLQAFTKAADRAEQPNIDYIKVAVFGTSGYTQAYSLAEPVNEDGSPRSAYATTNGDKYYFKVLLPVYEGEAHIHIIANGDESIKFVDETEDSIMESMETHGNVGAYWTRFVMPDGILPQKDENGIMQTDNQGNFLPSAETQSAFNDLILVRNFAEIVLLNEAEDDLHDITWTLVNVPTKGSVAPMAAGTYVDDYVAYEYDTATGKMVYGSKVYDGFMFEDEPMDYTIPEADDITISVNDPNFVYERTHPGSNKATCLLVKGKYKNDSDYSYYRIDLMDESVGGYFPLYRNYKYQVKIHKVGNRGASDPVEAMNRDSGGNVSMSTEAQKLTDISDGASRLYVEYVEKNFTSGGKKTIWVQYIPDVLTGTVDNSSVDVTIKDQGLALKEGTQIRKTEASTDNGYYIYEFELNGQDSNEDLVSVLQVSANNGKTDDDKSTLYRDITLRVMKTMKMELSLRPKKLDSGIGNKTILSIELPEDLPSSMFPLEIYIEDINHTINPTGKDGSENNISVPVKTAKSLADNLTNSFYFIRTVNEDDYISNPIITTEFQTIRDASATTIYVANEYFHTESINLLNDGIYVNPINATVAFNVTSVVVEVETEDESKTWTVTAPEGSGVTVTPSSGTGNGSFTMTFAQNSSTSTAISRVATVTSEGVDHTVTITQNPLEFSVTPSAQTVMFNTVSAPVTVHAEEGIVWTATVTGTGASITGAVEGVFSGEGTQTLTITFPVNDDTAQKDYVVTVNMTDPSATVSAMITQLQAPNSPYTFNSNRFTWSGNTGLASSPDNFVNVSLGNSQTHNLSSITMGYRTTRPRNTYLGTISVTPVEGFRITEIKVSFNDATSAGYEFANTRATVNTGSYTRDGSQSTTATWTGSSTDTVTITNGCQNTGNSYNFPTITSIEVTYEFVE